MQPTIHHIPATWFLALILGAALVSCASEDLGTDAALHAIALSSVEAEPEAADAPSARAMAKPLAHDFTVYGYKNVGGQEQLVFNGYAVKYRQNTAGTSTDNTHDYFYVEGAQSIKYWDYAASEYHFWGMWQKEERANKASFSGDKNKFLTIPDVHLRTGEPAPEDDVLYSALAVRAPVSSEVVQLQFKRPYAKVRIQFYTTEPIESEADNIALTNITFSPDPDASDPLVNQVYGQGTVKVTYPLPTDACTGSGRETVEVQDLANPRSALTFDMVTLTSTLGISSNTAVTAPIDDSEGFELSDMPGQSLKVRRKAGELPGRKYYYYPLPMGERNPAFTMSVCIDGSRELATAVVPATYMQWKPNYHYTYIFKITDAGKKIEFHDVLIDPWHYGGSQEEEWKNW